MILLGLPAAARHNTGLLNRDPPPLQFIKSSEGGRTKSRHSGSSSQRKLVNNLQNFLSKETYYELDRKAVATKCRRHNFIIRSGPWPH